MAKALYRKWRPQDWNEVTAQEHVIQTLQNAVINDRVGHAYLFAGPRGTGKTTTARLLAKAVNCLDPERKNRPCNKCEYCIALNAGRFLDLIEIDAASNTSVDDVRDLRDKINFSPSQGAFKVYIIDEVHMLSTAAFNALLKTLEEPPPHAIFILATTEIHKIPATVLSRCQWHEFRRIPIQMIVEHLKEKSEEENIKLDDSVFSEIARQATGSLRDAISLLDQLSSSTEHITLEVAQTILGTATNSCVIDIIEALIAKDSAKGLGQINTALDSGTDSRQLARQIVTYLRNILLVKIGNRALVEVPEDTRKMIYHQAELLTMPDLLTAIDAFNQATTQEHASWHPGLGLELAFTSYLVQPDPVNPTPQITVVSTDTQKPAKPKPRSQKLPEPIVRGEPSQKQTFSEQPVPVADKEQHEPPQASSDDKDPTSGDNIPITRLHQDWKKIKAMVRKHNPRTEGILNSAKVTGLKDNLLILGFSSDIICKMMEKEGNINLTADILEEVYGQPMRIKCIVTSQEGSTLPVDLDIDTNGMVGTATRDLGGKISSAEQAE